MPPRLLHVPKAHPAQHNLLSFTSRISYSGAYLDVPGVASSSGIRGSGTNWRVDLKKIAAGQCELETLAQWCGCSADTLAGLTYPAAQGSSLWGDHLFLGHEVPWAALDIRRPRYCPHCIAESPVYPRYWDLVWYTTCHLHQVPLVQSCQDCDALVEWSNWNWSDNCPKCGESRSAGALPPPPSTVDFCGQLSDIVRVPPHLQRQRMGSLSEILTTLSSLVVAAMPRAQLGRFDFSPHLWSITERQQLAAFAWPLIRDEFSSTTAMMEMLARSRQAFPHLTDDSRCLPLRAAIESVQHVQRRLWLRDQFAAALTAPSAVIAEICDSREEMATLEAAGTMLGASRHNLMALLQAGMLDGRFAHEGKRRSDWIVSIASIDSLLGRIAQVAIHTDRPGGSSAHAVAKTPPGAAVGGLPGIIKAACDGRLRVIAHARDYRFSSLEVDPDSLRAMTRPTASDALTVAEIAGKLGLYADAVYRLMKLGYLPFRKEKRAVSPQRVVDLTDFTRFAETYAVVTQIAAATKANPTNLSDRLIAVGLVPVSGPKIDGGLVYMFKREDLARIDLQEVLSRPGYKSRAGRPRQGTEDLRRLPDDVVDASTAAQDLGVSIQELGVLARTGALTEHPDSRRRGNRRYYYRNQIAELAGRYTGNPGLVPIEVVAAQLGRPVASLYMKEVRSGRLRVDRSPLGRAYLRRDEVGEVFEKLQTKA